VIRNAGGRASSDALQALAISQAVMHTREVMVIHHTDCALGRFSQAQLNEQITAASGHSFAEELGCFTDPIQAIEQDLERLRAWPYLPARDKVRGFMYDLTSSVVSEVPTPRRTAT
jgi:carbonic anhydrase